MRATSHPARICASGAAPRVPATRRSGVCAAARTRITPIIDDTSIVPTRKAKALLAATAALAAMAMYVHPAHASVFPNGDAGKNAFVGGGGGAVLDALDNGEEDEDYVYKTTDFAVDLASPLVAYRVVTTALKQEVPKWLDAVILCAALGAAWVVFTNNTSLDAYLH